MKREIRRDPAQPASSCHRCYRPGVVSDNQIDDNGRQRRKNTRFECPHCLNSWSTDAADAEAHGRFLQRIDQARNAT